MAFRPFLQIGLQLLIYMLIRRMKRTLCVQNNAEIAFPASHKQESCPRVSRVKSYKLSSANQRENKDELAPNPPVS